MAAAEAMARGLPLAITAGGAIAELVPVEAGAVSPPGDVVSLTKALRRMIFDTDAARDGRGGLGRRPARCRAGPTAPAAFAAETGEGAGTSDDRDSTSPGSTCASPSTPSRGPRRWPRALLAPLPARPRLLDLGAGTGSLLRWLAPRIGRAQAWTLVDSSAAMAEAAFDTIADRAEPIGLRGHLARTSDPAGACAGRRLAGGGAGRRPGGGARQPAAARGRRGAELGAVRPGVAPAGSERMAAALRVPFYAALCVDGRDRFAPPHPADARVARLPPRPGARQGVRRRGARARARRRRSPRSSPRAASRWRRRRATGWCGRAAGRRPAAARHRRAVPDRAGARPCRGGAAGRTAAARWRDRGLEDARGWSRSRAAAGRADRAPRRAGAAGGGGLISPPAGRAGWPRCLPAPPGSRGGPKTPVSGCSIAAAAEGAAEAAQRPRPARPLAQEALDAKNGVAARVEQVAHPAQQGDVLRPVVAPAAAALQRLELRELGFPETEDVLGGCAGRRPPR